MSELESRPWGSAIAWGCSHFHLMGALPLVIPTGGTVSQCVTCAQSTCPVMPVMSMLHTELSSSVPPSDVVKSSPPVPQNVDVLS